MTTTIATFSDLGMIDFSHLKSSRVIVGVVIVVTLYVLVKKSEIQGVRE